ncbi:MAG TPA: F0F1 ATP synthase subunit delta [Thermohalobaculum sp.]|nr:F0F1 ATP synthase subunit delta [Thermohalobaculum sp.]
MSDTSILVSDAAGRYATALFGLAREEDALEQTERDLDALGQALKESDDLRTLIASPIYDREDQSRGLAAVGEKMGLSQLVRNLVGLMVARRRIYMLPKVIDNFRALLAEHRGEVTAEVTAAKALTDEQAGKLAETLKGASGREVKLDVTVDEALIGGLVVRVGSRMIDTSIRSRLAQLENAMREVG